MHSFSSDLADDEWKLIELIGARTGLQVRDKDRASVLRALQMRLKARRLHRFEEYRALLEADGDEWNALLPHLTNGESYFFRDEGQIELLRARLLPELIRAHERDKTLRLWSAGCSTGEEPYTLAMLLDDLLPRRTGWNIQILGTDINEEALTRARRGIYSEWAFRAMDNALRRRYFQPVANGWEFKPALRPMVSFAGYNLGDDGNGAASLQKGGPKPGEMDLIVCRNVLIYFRPEAVGHALKHFVRALRPGGYLLTGHAELAHHNPSPLQARVLPGSIAYQRPPAEPIIKPLAPKPAPFTKTVTHARPSIVALPISNAPSAQVVQGSAAKPNAAPRSAAELCRQARQHADSGRYEEAVRCCIAASEAEPTLAEAYFVWAQVAHEQGRADEAKTLFKKVIYLTPTHVEAYLELGALYRASNETARARRMNSTALGLLRALPAASRLSSGANREELLEHVEALLATSDSPPASAPIIRGTR